jgi:hypothetical protein
MSSKGRPQEDPVLSSLSSLSSLIDRDWRIPVSAVIMGNGSAKLTCISEAIRAAAIALRRYAMDEGTGVALQVAFAFTQRYSTVHRLVDLVKFGQSSSLASRCLGSKRRAGNIISPKLTSIDSVIAASRKTSPARHHVVPAKTVVQQPRSHRPRQPDHLSLYAMPQVVLDVLYEIAAFSTGAFDFRTLESQHSAFDPSVQLAP